MNNVELASHLKLSSERIRNFTNGYKGYHKQEIEPIFIEGKHYTWKKVNHKFVKEYNPQLCKKAYYEFKTRNK